MGERGILCFLVAARSNNRMASPRRIPWRLIDGEENKQTAEENPDLLCSPCSGGHQSIGICELQEDLPSRRTWPGRLDPRIADLREQTLLANTTSKLLTTGLPKEPGRSHNGTTVRACYLPSN